MMGKQQYDNPRLREMLECGCPFKDEIRAATFHSVYRYTVDFLEREQGYNCDDTKLLHYICLGMGRYLRSYPTRPIFKQQLKTKLVEWIKEIEQAYHLPSNMIVDFWPDYVEKDTGIALVKLLHARKPGITKTALKEALECDSKKTVQNNLRKLDPSLNEAPQPTDPTPLRIGGHVMHVDIKCEPVPDSHGDRSYYTPNTLHPLVMQLNVTQTAAVLMALQNAYDRSEYSTYCADVALDIWCQLSDYCKERIELIFTQNNPEFKVFLRMLSQEIEDGRYPEFKTERIMAESGTLTEQLEYACKTNHLCNIILKFDGDTVVRQKNRILKNNDDQYFCMDERVANPEESMLFFTEANVKTLEIV